MNKYCVEVNREYGFIRISRNGKEILYWDELEWVEDGEVTYTIAKAIVLALTNAEAMDQFKAVPKQV